MRTESKQQLGVCGEDLACAELERQGMQVLERNWRCRSAITFAKMQTLRQLAALWMRQHRMKASRIRLDAIGVVFEPGREPTLTHVKAVG